MKRVFILLGMLLMFLPAFSGCGLEDSGNLNGDAGLGGKGGTGGTGVGGGTCFPGSKVCPDPKTKELLCLDANSPETGCKTTTACDPCAVPHATANCSAEGKCAIKECNAGWADCNGSSTDGCETDLNGDKNHCGTCELDCTTAVGQGPGWICNGGKCEVNQCCPTGDPQCLGLRDCDGDKTNGCEVDVSKDPNNCKTCGTVCNLTNADSTCSQETCVITQCKTGFANCDSNDANGCEINITNDSGNCGACGTVCNSTNGVKACSGGNCEISCFPDFGNCDNNAGGNGCESNLKTDALNCNSCGNQCNPAHATGPTCTNGGCGYTACNAGYKDCDGNKPNGCEINSDQDKNNCGNCGTVCPVPSGGQALCVAGSCGNDCGSLKLCGSVCVNTGSDINNCGNCNVVCNPPANSQATCNGTCGFNCNSGFAKCGSTTQCYNTQNDPAHCGACVNCPGPGAGTGNPTCSGGGCGITCTGGTPNKCGNNCYNFQTDKNHCGSCGGVCTNPQNGTNNCVGGGCQITCNSGFTLCGSQCVNTSNDNSHCGDCTTVCGGGKTCQSSSCQCGSGLTDCSGTCVNLQTSKNNCNSCGHVCAGASSSCVGGACTCTPATNKYCDDTVGCQVCCSNPDCGGSPQKCCTASTPYTCNNPCP